MKLKTSELTDAALDYACAIAAGFTYTMRPVSCEIVYAHASGEYHFGYGWSPSTNWSQGGPIIERENISLDQREGEPCRAYIYFDACEYLHAMFAPERQPLIAAMRCFVASRLGDEVDVPDELLKG